MGRGLEQVPIASTSSLTRFLAGADETISSAAWRKRDEGYGWRFLSVSVGTITEYRYESVTNTVFMNGVKCNGGLNCQASLLSGISAAFRFCSSVMVQ